MEKPSGKFTVLSGENYNSWAFKMEAYLMRQDLWDIVKGAVARPQAGEEVIRNLWDKGDSVTMRLRSKETSKSLVIAKQSEFC